MSGTLGWPPPCLRRVCWRGTGVPSHSRTSVALVLAIDPAFKHHDALQRLADDSAAHEIVFASSCDEALAIISRHIPDLVVFPIFCSDADEVRIVGARECAVPRRRSAHAGYPVAGVHGCRNARPHPLDGSTGSNRGTKPRRDLAILARSPMRFATIWKLVLANFRRDCSASSLRRPGIRWRNDVAAAARTIVARLSGLGPEHVLVWRQRMSLPRWVRPAGAALMLAVAAAPALARASLASLTRPKAEHPLVPGPRTSPPPWLQSARGGAATGGDGVGTSGSGEALWSQTRIPPRPGPA